MDIETRLREDLADTAATIERAPDGLFADVVAGARRQRRNRVAALGAAACAVIAAVTVPLVVTDGPSHTPATGDTAAPSATATATYQPSVAYERYPYDPRGSLAGDRAYVQGLLDLPWKRLDGSLELIPEPTRKQVVFAGAVPGGVQALVIGWDDARVVDGEPQPAGWVSLWLHGPAGTSAADLQVSAEPGRIDPTLPVSQSVLVDGVGAMVVIARPGDVIEYSRGTVIKADGTIEREPYTVVGDASGVAAIDVAGTSGLTSAVRVTRDGKVVEARGGIWGMSDGGTDPGAFDPTTALVGAAGTPDAGLVRLEMSSLLPEIGLTQDQVETHVLWGGPLGAPKVPDAEAAVFTVRVPSGAVVLVGAMGQGRSGASDGGGFTSVGACAKAVLPAGTDVAATGVAMRCDPHSTKNGAVLASRLVVLPPAGTARIDLAREAGDGSTVTEGIPAQGPAVVTDVPDGLSSVTALDGFGAVLGAVPLREVQDVRLHD